MISEKGWEKIIRTVQLYSTKTVKGIRMASEKQIFDAINEELNNRLKEAEQKEGKG